MKWNVVFNVMAWITITFALVSILLFTFLMVRPYRGLYDVTQPVPIMTKTVEVGALAVYQIHYCIDNELPLPLATTRELELQGPDGLVLAIAPPIEYLILNRCETRTFAFGVPTYIPAGEYHVHFITDVRVNPVRDIRQRFVSENFQIVLSQNAFRAAKKVVDTAVQTAKDLKKR